MFALLRRFVKFVRELQHEPEKESLYSLLYSTLRVTDSKIDIDDVVEWTKGNMEELQKNGIT